MLLETMIPRPVFIALLVLAGPTLVFEAYGIHRLSRPVPPSIEATLDTLCANLLQAARGKGLTGIAREIREVTGPAPDPYFDSLPPFLNARLEPGFKQFLLSDEARASAVAEVGRLMKRQEWVASPSHMTQAVPDVLLQAEWKPLSSEEVGLTLRAVRWGVSGEGVQAATRFPHPNTVQQDKRQRVRLQRALYGAAVPLVTLTFLSIGTRLIPRPSGG